MEGSRHEKAALVLAAYVIGFTTASILYSELTAKPADLYMGAPQMMPAAAIEATSSYLADEPQTEVSYIDGKLTVEEGDKIVLLSFNPETSDIVADTANLSQGYHFGDIDYTTSPANEYVFFCERQDLTAETCLGFVYSVATDTIYFVTKNGATILISQKSAQTATWSEAGLTIGGVSSQNAASPWQL